MKSFRTVFILLVLLLAVTSAIVADWEELPKLTASDGEVNHNFGTSAAATDTMIVIGAPPTNGAGRVYVYTPDVGGEYVETKLSASNGFSNDYFGYAVASNGTAIVVGAMLGNAAKGAAYVYTPNGGGFSETPLTASDGAGGDTFGLSVAIGANGQVVVGAPSDDNKGSAYIFTPDGMGGYTQLKVTATDGAANDLFGQSVAIDSSGLIFVGAPGDDSRKGAIYRFTPNGVGGYNQTKFTAFDGTASDAFGWAMAADGTTLVVTAYEDENHRGAAYVFTPDGVGGYTQTKLTASDGAASDEFGMSVAAYNGKIVVGADADDSTRGAAYLFTPDGVGGYTEKRLTASDRAQDDYFGRSVAISAHGIIVGSHSDDAQGSAYVYRLFPDVPTNLTATSDGTSKIDLTWNAAAHADNYRVERSPNGNDSWAEIGTTPALSYADTTAACASTYFYRVYALNNAGDSEFSNVADATTDSCPPDLSPFTLETPLSGTVIRTMPISFSWIHAVGASEYTLQLWKISNNARIGETQEVTVDAAAICAAALCTQEITVNHGDGVYVWTVIGRNDFDDLEASNAGFLFTLDQNEIELVTNGSFEDGLNGWTRLKPTGDKVICKEAVAYAGACAYRFKGSQREASSIVQKVNLTGIEIGSGDTLTLNAYVKAGSAAAAAKIKVRVTYATQGTPKGKLNLPVGQTSGYQLVTSSLPLTDQVKAIKLVMTHTSASGKLFVDGLSLKAASTTAPLELPSAP